MHGKTHIYFHVLLYSTCLGTVSICLHVTCVHDDALKSATMSLSEHTNTSSGYIWICVCVCECIAVVRAAAPQTCSIWKTACRLWQPEWHQHRSIIHFTQTLLRTVLRRAAHCNAAVICPAHIRPQTRAQVCHHGKSCGSDTCAADRLQAKEELLWGKFGIGKWK